MDRLIADINARIRAFERDPGAVLDDGALRVARSLWEQASADGNGVPLDVAIAVAWLHWCRFAALGDAGDDDLRAALSLFEVIAQVDRDAVPDEVLSHLDARGTVVGGSGFVEESQPHARVLSAMDLIRRAPADPAALRQAIGMLAAATDALPDDDPDLAGYLLILSDTCQNLVALTGDPAELDKASAATRRAVAVSPPGPGMARALAMLCLTQQSVHRHTDADAPLDEAVDAGRRAVAVTPPTDPELPAYLSILGLALRSRIARSGRPEDVGEAITLAREAIRLTPPDHPDPGERWSMLALALRARYVRGGDRADIEEIVAAARRATELTPGDHRNLPARLSHLGEALALRFERLGGLPDLDEAVGTARRAVTAARPDDEELDRMLAHLGNALRLRFERTGRRTDLDEAVDALRRAVAVSRSTPAAGSPGGWLSNLGAVLRLRFRRTGDPADLDEAITVIREAVDTMPATDHEWSAALANLSGALNMRFERAGDPADLDEAIAVGRRAVAATPPDHPNHHALLGNLSGLLDARFERLADPADLDEAIAGGRRAVAAIPAGHPNLAGLLGNLGTALAARFTSTGEPRDYQDALDALARAADAPTAPASVRLHAAHSRAETIARVEGPAAAVPAYTAAIALLPLVLWRGVGRDDQQYVVEKSATAIARDAAACAIAAGDPGAAVELLEQGRGIIWSSMLEARTDLTALERAHPDTAAALAACRDRLDDPDTADEDARLRAGRDFDALVAEVRGLPPTPDFPDPAAFLRPPRVADLLPAPGTGRIVVVNVSSWRCDALVLEPDGVRCVPLPSLTLGSAQDTAASYLAALLVFEASRGDGDDHRGLEAAITTTLEWLWDHIADTVLTGLGHVDSPTNEWPRLWWCPTGVLTLLPLHAAGYHDGTGTSVVDRVVSSYTPTIRSLAHSRTRPAPSSQAGMLVVSLPDTPGQRALAGAEAEREILTQLFERATVLADRDATRDAIGAELVRHRWFHASCHGSQDLEHPAAGGLLPHDWDTAGLVGVDTLTGKANVGGEFAFLAACKTAVGGLANLDEVITIASAMHHAGWRHVVATLWSVWDPAALAVTRDFYRQVARDGRLDSSQAAHALHRVTRGLRDRRRHRPSAWAPFIHVGT